MLISSVALFFYFAHVLFLSLPSSISLVWFCLPYSKLISPSIYRHIYSTSTSNSVSNGISTSYQTCSSSSQVPYLCISLKLYQAALPGICSIPIFFSLFTAFWLPFPSVLYLKYFSSLALLPLYWFRLSSLLSWWRTAEPPNWVSLMSALPL